MWPCLTLNVLAEPGVIKQHKLTDFFRKLESGKDKDPESAAAGAGHSGSGSDDGEEKDKTGAGDADTKKEKRLMAPRKKFEWTDHIRWVLHYFLE